MVARNGTIIVAGGEMPATDYPTTRGMDLWLVEGRWSIRTFDRITQQWTTQPQQLHTAHWYPTQV